MTVEPPSRRYRPPPRIQLGTPDPGFEKQSSSLHRLSQGLSPVGQAVRRQSGIPTISISTSKERTGSHTPAAKERPSPSHIIGSSPRTPLLNRFLKESTTGSRLASMLKKKTYQALSLANAKDKVTDAEHDGLLKPPHPDFVPSWNTPSKKRAVSMPEPVSHPHAANDVCTHADPLANFASDDSPPIVDFTSFEDRYRSSSRNDCDGLLSPSPDKKGSNATHASNEGKLHPLVVIDSLIVVSGGTTDVRNLFNVDELLMIHEGDQRDLKVAVMERENVDQNVKERAVMGETIQKVSMYASTTMIFGGREFELPIVVVQCVEELYRTGIYQPNLFRSLPNRPRLHELISIFDSKGQPPGSIIRSRHSPTPLLSPEKGFGAATSLHLESTPDICALLTSYLSALPEPILPSHLFEPIWVICGIGDCPEIEMLEPCVAPISTSRSCVPMRLSTVPLARSYTPSSEATCILAAQLLLHLLPSPHFSLFVYLLAFFSQVALVSEENGAGVEDLSRMFGARIFGHGRGDPSLKLGAKSAEVKGKEKENDGRGEMMMVWFLRRWGPISERLFDAVDDARSAALYSIKPAEKDVLGSATTTYDAHGAQYAGESEEKHHEDDRVVQELLESGDIDLRDPAALSGSSSAVHVLATRPILSSETIDTEDPEFLESTNGPFGRSFPKFSPELLSSPIPLDTWNSNQESTPPLRVKKRADARHLSRPLVGGSSIDSSWGKLQQRKSTQTGSNTEVSTNGLAPQRRWDTYTGPDQNNSRLTETNPENAADRGTALVLHETSLILNPGPSATHERLLDISMPATMLNLEESMILSDGQGEVTSKLSSTSSSSVLSSTAPVTLSQGHPRYHASPVLHEFEQRSASSLPRLPPRPPKNPKREEPDGSHPRLSRYRSHNETRVLNKSIASNDKDPTRKDAIIDSLRVQLIETERERDEAKRVVTEVKRVLGGVVPSYL